MENEQQGGLPVHGNEEKSLVNRGKVLAGAAAAVVAVAALYLANRYWIAPLTMHQAQAHAKSASDPDQPLAPDFTLTALNGQKLSLADYKGKVVLLDFWATWCGPCRIEIPGFIELQNKYRDQGFTVIGISMDEGGPEVVKEFYQDYKMNYPVALGTQTVSELYGGVYGLPTTFVIGRDGRIYSRHPGAEPASVFEDEVKTLLGATGTTEVGDFHPAGHATPGDKIELGTPEEANSEVPGVDVSKLTAVQKADFKKVLQKEQCTCGCKFDLLKCRLDDRSCGVSRKMAKEELAIFLGQAEPLASHKKAGTQSAPAAAPSRN
jgi:peroxiredoxin